jgi:uncharacterized protein YegL
MFSKSLLDDGLIENPAKRVPVCLCLDVSGSMSGEPINELNLGIAEFYKAIQDDDAARVSAEIAIVTFDDNAKVFDDFSTIEGKVVPTLSAGGATNMGAGVKKALEILEQRKRAYKAAGTDYFQPWLIIMSDGGPTDSEYIEAQNLVKNLESSKRLAVFPIAIGAAADRKVLSNFSNKKDAIKLQGLKFKEFFEWLSMSVSTVSNSKPNEVIVLDVNAIKNWGDL